MGNSPKSWCEWHEDRRSFFGQSTTEGEVVDIYTDELRLDCRYYEGTGKLVADGHRPRIMTEREKGEGRGESDERR